MTDPSANTARPVTPVTDVSRENFAATVLSSAVPVLVEFWGPRCIPCMQLAPIIDELAELYHPELKVVKVDVTKNRRLCAERRVFTLPAFLFFQNGTEVMRIGPETTADHLRETVRTFLGGAT